MAFKLEPPADNLVIVSIRLPMTSGEVPQFATEVSTRMHANPGKGLLLVDLTACGLFPAHLADEWVGVMKKDNGMAQRVAVWLPDSGLFGAQMERMVNKAGGTKRRVCRSSREVEEWLGEFANPNEVAALRRYVAVKTYQTASK